MEVRLTRFVISTHRCGGHGLRRRRRHRGRSSPSTCPAARRLARPPILNYHVGAGGLDAGGWIYIGVNLEFPGVPLHHIVDAEQFLLANANAHGELSLRCFAISSAPYGHCRQFLQELHAAVDVQSSLLEELVVKVVDLAGGASCQRISPKLTSELLT